MQFLVEWINILRKKGYDMKKIICYFLTVSLLFQCCTLSVHAIESEKKRIEIYDYYESDNKTVILYFQDNTPYIEPNELALLTDYVYALQDGKIVFEKKSGLQTTKRVSLKDGKIQYGSYKHTIRTIDVDGVTYIELIPTIDYLDSRLKMSPDGRLILFSAEKTFSQLVNQVSYDLVHGGNIEDNANNLESGAAWLWLLLNGKLLSSMPGERSRRLAFSLLTEEDKDNFILESNRAIVDYASTVSNDVSFISSVGEMMNLEIFDKSLKVFGDHMNMVTNSANLDYEMLSRMANIQLQIEQLYTENIKNVEKTLLNPDMHILSKTDSLYKDLKKITNGYNKNSERMYQDAMMGLYKDEGISFIKNTGGDIIASTLIKTVPALDVGLSLLKVYGNISGVTDGAVSVIEQKDYTALQSKIAVELQKYHNQIKKGGTLSEEKIRDYVELARMYYHVKTAYYHMYNDYAPDPLFENNYLQYLNIEKGIDKYGHDVFTLDIPNANSTDINTLIFPKIEEIQLTQEFEMEDFSCSIYLPQNSILSDYKKNDGSTLSYIWNYKVPYIDKLENRTIQIIIIESFQPYDGIQRNMDEYKDLNKNSSNGGEEQYLGDQTRFIRIWYPYELFENGETTIATIDFQNIETKELINYYLYISVDDSPENIDSNDLLFIKNLAFKIAESCTML